MGSNQDFWGFFGDLPNFVETKSNPGQSRKSVNVSHGRSDLKCTFTATSFFNHSDRNLPSPMQANNTVPQLTPALSDFKKVLTVAGLGVSAFFLSKFGRGSTNNNARTPKLPQRRVDAVATNFPTLKEAAEVDASLLGNKGLNLSNLMALGFDVPAGFVVTTRVYEEHIRNSGADELIEELNSAAAENGSTGTFKFLYKFGFFRTQNRKNFSDVKKKFIPIINSFLTFSFK